MLPALLLLPSHWPELTRNLSRPRAAAGQPAAAGGWSFRSSRRCTSSDTRRRRARRRRGARHGRDAAGADAGAVCRRIVGQRAALALAAGADRRRRHAGRAVRRGARLLRSGCWSSRGCARAVCFNVMLVAGVSTLVFNGNPLLRYDAYYILCRPDRGAEPGAPVASRYWGYLIQRHLLRLRDAEPRNRKPSERIWFAAYGLVSTLYRMFVTVAIALFIGTQFFFIGVVLALWAVAGDGRHPARQGAEGAAGGARGAQRPGRGARPAGRADRGAGAGVRGAADALPDARPKAWCGCPSRRSCAPAQPASSASSMSHRVHGSRPERPLAHSIDPELDAQDPPAACPCRRAGGQPAALPSSPIGRVRRSSANSSSRSGRRCSASCSARAGCWRVPAPPDA